MKQKMLLESIVEQTFRLRPQTIGNNDLLWVEVCKALCEANEVNELDSFFLSVLRGDIPSAHSLAAAVSLVRKKHPELRPTDEQLANKLAVKQEYINQYKNA
jgi:hypothetical protein